VIASKRSSWDIGLSLPTSGWPSGGDLRLNRSSKNTSNHGAPAYGMCASLLNQEREIPPWEEDP